jgi:hypothetical protein
MHRDTRGRVVIKVDATAVADALADYEVEGSGCRFYILPKSAASALPRCISSGTFRGNSE